MEVNSLNLMNIWGLEFQVQGFVHFSAPIPRSYIEHKWHVKDFSTIWTR